MHGRPTEEPGSEKRCATAHARQVGATVRLVTLSSLARPPERVTVVAKRGATMCDGSQEDPAKLAREGLALVPKQGVRWLERMDPRCEEALVGVDVANAGDPILIE